MANTNTVDEAIMGVHQILTNLERRQADMGVQIQRLQRFSKLDERELAVDKMRSERQVLEAVETLAYAVETLTTVQRDPIEAGVSASTDLYWSHKRQQETRTGRNLNHTRYLLSLKQQKTFQCCHVGADGQPDHMHMGIQFLDHKGEVVDELCPTTWYVKLCALDFANKNGSAWADSHPYAEFIKPYQFGQ